MILRTSAGMTVSVILDAATGAITFTLIFLLSPSFAKAVVNPTNASFAAE
jgi:hypothetical protein